MHSLNNKIASQSIPDLVDDIFQLNSREQIIHKLSTIKYNSNNASGLYQQLIDQLKIRVLSQHQSKITTGKLYTLQILCNQSLVNTGNKNDIDANCFKGNNIYTLVAAAQGYLQAVLQIRGHFGRNLKRTPQYWGTQPIQSLYTSLTNKTAPSTTRPTHNLPSKQYLWQFIRSNLQLFPTSFDFYQYALKHMLSLRPDIKNQLPLFNTILQIFLQYQYSYQCLCKNFRFMLEFFRSDLNQKQMGGFQIYSSCMLILKNYSSTQIDNIFMIGSLGINWNQNDVANCITNILKLGITQQSFRLMKCFIEMFKKSKKYHELSQAYEKNINKIFVFLKYPQLYQASMKVLKQFVLGPWNISSLYNAFAIKAIQFAKAKNINKTTNPMKEQCFDFLMLICCMIQKYKQTTLVTDLQQLAQDNLSDYPSLDTIKQQTSKYDWKIFEKAGNKKQSDGQQTQEIRGIINIGNSCYMNSFIQCLYMTKEYRKIVLQAKPLEVEKQVLTKYEQLFPNHVKQNKNLALLSRETVRPLAELQRTFGLLLKSKRPSINPTNIKNISPPQFRNNFQHDTIEFGRFLIQTISRSVNHVFEGEMTTQIECPYCGAKRSKVEEFLDFMVNPGEEQEGADLGALVRKSLENEEMMGLVCETCNNNNNKKDTYDGQMEMMIDQKYQQKQEQLQRDQRQYSKQIQNNQQFQQNSNSVNNIPQQTMQQQNKSLPTQTENVQQIAQQQKQNKHKQQNNGQIKMVSAPQQLLPSIKSHYISKPPSNLILTLKRFEYNIKQNKNIKKQYKLDLQQTFKIDEIVYIIYAIIVHRGVSANSGHYFTFARFGSQGQGDDQVASWLCLNDTIVTKLQNFTKVLQFLSSNPEDTPYIIFAMESKYWQQNKAILQKPIHLRPNLQSYIQKDDAQYIKSLGNKGKIDLSLLKFATGNYRRDDRDQQGGQGGPGWGAPGNNPIM